MARAIRWVAAVLVTLVGGQGVAAETPSGPRLDVYGFAMTDSGYNFGTSDPDWYDVVRPTKLPAFEGEFGGEGRWFFGVRQSRFGMKAYLPTKLGELKVHLEAELFGTGVDAGRTMFRLRHAFGQLGQFGAGQTWSPFMDPDVFPNSIEYWGPNGMVFFRNVQIRWQPFQGMTTPHELQIAVENPGGSADVDNYEGRIELEGVTPRFPVPDVSAHYRYNGGFGHVQLAGIFRYIGWDDFGTDPFDITGHAIGWGVNLSSNIKLPMKSVLKLQLVYGKAIQNYMNDAAVDIAAEPGTTAGRPVDGVSLGTLGAVAFLDLTWTDWATSTIGYSYVRVYNSANQSDTDFRLGHYALANVLVSPVKDLVLGPELQWAERRNFRGNYSYDAFRIQFSMKYSFSSTFGITK